MRKAKNIALVLLLAGSLVGVVSVSAADTPFLPGVTVKDEHPNGCVDCHRQTERGDYRLNAEVAKVKGHPNIDRIVKTAPNDCLMCHKAGAKAGPLSQVVHKIHFSDPSENHFVSHYQGACLNCHAIDLSTGAMSVKSGAKNW